MCLIPPLSKTHTTQTHLQNHSQGPVSLRDEINNLRDEINKPKDEIKITQVPFHNTSHGQDARNKQNSQNPVTSTTQETGEFLGRL
jgi:hypothetical protein